MKISANLILYNCQYLLIKFQNSSLSEITQPSSSGSPSSPPSSYAFSSTAATGSCNGVGSG
jgi:hypothetical protein